VIDGRSLARADADALDTALAWLYRRDRGAHDRVVQVVQGVRFARDGLVCAPGATSCAGGALGPVIVFQRRPSGMGVSELAGYLYHEALHLDPFTGATLHHAWGTGRPTQAQRALDPIYREVDRVCGRPRP
jgi:hypothetical protein